MQYLWVDPKGKKCKCAAPQYVDYVMLTTEQTLNDETVFPTKYGNTFPSSFEWTVRRIMTWLYHVLAHLYHAHYKEVVALCLHAHLNTLFLHLCIFCKRHSLLEDKEMEALDDLYEKLRQPTPVPSTVETVEGGQGDSTSSNSPTDSSHPVVGMTERPQPQTVVDDNNKENNHASANVKSQSSSSSSSSCANGQAATGTTAAVTMS